MTRIAELQEKYPDIPIEVIARWEFLNRGIRDNSDLDKMSRWRPAGDGSYQSYDHDITLKELVEKTPERVKEGFLLKPRGLYLKNGLALELNRNTTSPYEVREIGDGKFALFEGEEKLDLDLYLRPPRERTTPEPVTSTGRPISSLIEINDRACFRITPVRHCEYFAAGDQCRFCNFNPSQEDARSIGLNRPMSAILAETVEAFHLWGSEVRILHGQLECGGFQRSEAEAAVHFRFVEKLATANPYTPYMRLCGEALEREQYQRLKDAGMQAVYVTMEVWDERLFPKILPGKSKHMSRERWLEALLNAVDIFGVGNVGAAFVGGVTLFPEDGFATWQEARDSQIEGNTWLIQHEVMTGWTAIRWAPGSVFSQTPANRTKFPPTEFYLDVAMAHHRAFLEYGMYEKMNRFFRCALNGFGHGYSGEIGMLAIAGDLGTWMAKVVSPEENTLAQFIASIKH